MTRDEQKNIAMSDEDKETQELEQRMRLAMQKAGFIIPSDLDVDEELPAESMRAKIPEELSDIDAAIERLQELEKERDEARKEAETIRVSLDAGLHWPLPWEKGTE